MAKSQENGTTILLGLKGHKVGEVSEEERGIVVEVEADGKKPGCPRCSSAKLYRHGRAKKRKVLHGWSQGKKVYLEISRHRWQCCDCGHSFTGGVGLVRSYSRLTRLAEAKALWQLKYLSFSQVNKELGISYSTSRRLLEREIDEEVMGLVKEEDAIFLGIDEHSFRHHDMVHTITEVKKRKMPGILRDDRMATLKMFLRKIPQDRVKEVCIDMKESLRKVAEKSFPEAKVVVDPFHVVADSNRRMDEARRIEQDVLGNKKVKIPGKLFLIGGKKLGEAQMARIVELLNRLSQS